LGSGDFENVAWRVSNVDYNPPVAQTVPVHFISTLGFGIASKEQDKYIITGQVIPMESLQSTVDIVNSGGEQTFQNLHPDTNLNSDQIGAHNKAQAQAGVSVGFVDASGFNLASAAYIGDLDNQSTWIATYHPNMSLYVASDAKAGQVISTVEKTDLIYTWDWASSGVQDQSQWLLSLDNKDTYVISGPTTG